LKKIANEANEAKAQMNMYVFWPNEDSHNSGVDAAEGVPT